MAEIIQNEGGKQKGKRRSKRHSTHIDMTPMVDLACLLLTFFMLTSQISKPKVMEIVLPPRLKPGEISNQEVSKGRALNIILVKDDKVLWYNGLADPTEASLPTLNETDFSDEGIREVLLKRNKNLFTQLYQLNDSIIRGDLDIPYDSIDARKRKYMRADKNGPVVLIKAYDDVKYRNFVDIIDEMKIANIAVYSLTDLNYVEKKMLADYFAAKSSGAASNK